jgi:bifunctional pyridoxal-dependent enzyme with beta-cystathionase and maltose regulon repressor activities
MASNEIHFNLLMQASNHLSTVHGSNVLAQVAATTALTKCNYWLDAFVQHLQQMRKISVARLNEMPGISCYAPQGCYVAFANITATKLSSIQISERSKGIGSAWFAAMVWYWCRWIYAN